MVGHAYMDSGAMGSGGPWIVEAMCRVWGMYRDMGLGYLMMGHR